jgi:hypothetical protein
MVPSSWSVRHFSEASPEGHGQDDVPALLRRLADSTAATITAPAPTSSFRPRPTSMQRATSHPFRPGVAPTLLPPPSAIREMPSSYRQTRCCHGKNAGRPLVRLTGTTAH